MSPLREYQASLGNKLIFKKALSMSEAKLRIVPFPFNYFGVPIFNGKMKAVFYEHLVEKVRSRLEG